MTHPDETISDERLAELLAQPDPEFDAWRNAVPDKHWSKYDLSALKLGWSAGRIGALSEIKESVADLARQLRADTRSEAGKIAEAAGRMARRDGKVFEVDEAKLAVFSLAADLSALRTVEPPKPVATEIDGLAAKLVDHLKKTQASYMRGGEKFYLENSPMNETIIALEAALGGAEPPKPVVMDELEAAKTDAINMLLRADDFWADYGNGFRVHFSFSLTSDDIGVVERITTARSLEAALGATKP